LKKRETADVKLTEEEVKALEAPYMPHPVVGIS
jgi:hypothetical protein